MPSPLYRQPTDADREAVWDLVAAAFGLARLADPALRHALADEPVYAADRTVIAEDGGTIVGHLACDRWAVSLGGGFWLPVARLGSVAVAADRRREGIGRRLVDEAAARWPDVAAIVLNPAHEEYVLRFYRRQGFAEAQRSIAYHTMDPTRVGRPRCPVAVRPAAPSDAPAIAALYEAAYGPLPGTLSRPECWWRRRIARQPLLWSPPLEILVAERFGRPAAYLMHQQAESGWQILDWAGADEAAQAVLAAACAGRTDRAGLYIGVDEPLFGLLADADPRDESPAPIPLMMRAHRLDGLRPVLADLIAARGGALSGDDQSALVTAGAARLRADWSRLLALAYNGAPLADWALGGAVDLSPSTELLAMQRVLPARRASRRPADGF